MPSQLRSVASWVPAALWSCKMRFLRRKRAVCLILTATFFAVSLMLTQTILRDGHNRSNDPDDQDFISDVGPMKGQLRFLNFVSQDNVTRSVPQCLPVQNVAFVKTHKAGSSTVANILQRYGITHNLNFALPNTMYHVYAYNYISKPGEILTRDKVIPIPKGQEYNILFNHAIYNRTAFHEIMPQNTSYITILREPFQQFVSAFEYYHVDRIFAIKNADIVNQTNPISTYLANPAKFERGVNYFSYIKNKQAEDLGMSKAEYFSHRKRQEYISHMDKDFSLVMIMEYFDESLLLLKRHLCWETKDVLYIPKNTNRHKPYRNFTKDDYERHRQMSHLDYSLYIHYLAIFKQKVRTLGEEFYQELTHFKKLLEQVKRSCLSNKSIYVHESRWHDSFEVTLRDCNLMLVSELAGLDKLFARAGRVIREKVNLTLSHSLTNNSR